MHRELARHVSTRMIALVLVLPLLFVLLSGAAAWRTDRSARDAVADLARVQEIRQELPPLLQLLVDMESGQRGYMLTGSGSFLEPYHQAEAQLGPALNRLAELARVHPSDRELVGRLRPVVDAKVAFMRELVAQTRSGAAREALAVQASGEGQRRMELVRGVLSDWEVQLAQDVSRRRDRLEDALDWSRWSTQGAIAVQLSLCGVAAYALWRWSKLRGLVTVCAWSKTIRHGGEWISFEEYLAREFGIRTSHGMSPGQAARLRAELERRKVGEGV